MNMGSSNRSTSPRSFKRPTNPGIKLTAPFAFLGVVLNGIISGAGYLDVAGYLNYYKINIVEADLPISSYLFYGYTYILNWWNVITGSGWLTVSLFIVIVTIFVFFFLRQYYPTRSTSNNVMIAYAIGSLVCISPAFPIVTAYQHGKETAHWELRSDFKGFGLQSSKAVKTYYLDGGDKLVGWSLFTAPTVAWIVVDDAVYKISIFDRKILLRIDYKKIVIPRQVEKAEIKFWQSISEHPESHASLRNIVLQ